MDLKLLTGNLNNLIEEKKYTKYYMHRSGHWLGLDVHDVGKYKIDNNWREFQENMCLTIEPGIYVPEWNIGIRIEDDILVTKNGCENLSESAPKIISEIEQCMT